MAPSTTRILCLFLIVKVDAKPAALFIYFGDLGWLCVGLYLTFSFIHFQYLGDHLQKLVNLLFATLVGLSTLFSFLRMQYQCISMHKLKS